MFAIHSIPSALEFKDHNSSSQDNELEFLCEHSTITSSFFPTLFLRALHHPVTKQVLEYCTISDQINFTQQKEFHKMGIQFRLILPSSSGILGNEITHLIESMLLLFDYIIGPEFKISRQEQDEALARRERVQAVLSNKL
jgi:hypothetical protein